jgi:signal transduction histidine kinase
MLMEDYCSRLGIQLERRFSGLALLEAKQQAEKAAIVANELMMKAKAADRAKSNFLANMAHELRTPLNAIIGFSEIIKLDKMREKGCYQEYAGYIHDAGTILLDILNAVLELARIDAGRTELEEQLVTLDDLVQSALAVITPIAQKKFLNVDSKLCQPPVMIWVDRSKFRQVIVNLLSNAVKFTEPQGRLSIRSDLASHGELAISISDTGIGIRPERIVEGYNPFEQVEDHLSRENAGAGLGLPIARALINLHGGELALTSERGVGTTAIVRLPRDRVHCVASSAA